MDAGQGDRQHRVPEGRELHRAGLALAAAAGDGEAARRGADLLRDSLAIYTKRNPTGPLRYDTESLLGAALAGQKKWPEAEPLLVRSATAFEANYARSTPALQRLAVAALERVIDFHVARGEQGQANEWRRKLAAMKASTKKEKPQEK